MLHDLKKCTLSRLLNNRKGNAFVPSYLHIHRMNTHVLLCLRHEIRKVYSVKEDESMTSEALSGLLSIYIDALIL